MDSGNNSGGSMQSSSGGDEEYDSRPDSISPFFNPPPTHFGSTSSNPIPPPNSIHHHHQSTTLFNNPQFHSLASFSQSPTNPNPNQLYNLDSIWSRAPRPDPNQTQFGNPIASSSSSAPSLSSSSSQAPLGLSQGPFTGPFQVPPTINSDQPTTVKTSKKRTRASRRAPTTVLTTDMSNFRQMVQEFTGIPAAPFSASPYSRRLDLFSTGSSMRSGPLEPLGPLYRAAAHKVQSSGFLSSSLSSSSSLLNSTMINPNNSNYQLPSDLGGLNVPKQPPNHSMQNQMLNFQSLLQFPFPPPVFGSKSQGNSTIPLMDELGMSHHDHGFVNSSIGKGFPNISDGSSMLARSSNNNGGDGDRQQQEQSRNFNGGNSNSQHDTSSFHPEKGLENVSSRGGEGTVDSFFVQQ